MQGHFLSFPLSRCAVIIAALLSVAGTAVAGGNDSPVMSGPAWIEQTRKDALTSLVLMNSSSLEEIRETCVQGQANIVKRKQEARGNGFPDAHEWCRAAADASAPRKLSQSLYVALALQDMGKANAADTAADFAAVSGGEDSKLAAMIVKAAGKGDTTYTGLSGKSYALRPELAYDVGHYYAQLRPDRIPPIADRASFERVAQACFAETPATILTLDGAAMPATRACLIVGGNAGKLFATAIQ